MEIASVPESVQAIHSSLSPHLKERNEVKTIKRVLALHLSTCLKSEGSHLQILRPLSFPPLNATIEGAPNGVRGYRREYLCAIKANLNARKQYDTAVKEFSEQQLKAKLEPSLQETGNVESYSSQFLDVIQIRRKHDRLRILQDYVDILGQKPAASAEHFSLNEVLKNAANLPQVSPEVMERGGRHMDWEEVNLKDLVFQLEKAVLRAKLLLRKEQKLLEKVKSESQIERKSFDNQEGKLQALGITRNELINWIETELGKAGNSTQEVDDGSKFHSGAGKESIQMELLSIQRQYSRYTSLRADVISAINGKIDTFKSDKAYPDMTFKEDIESSLSTTKCHIISPYLEDLAIISYQQKSLIQQRSHLTSSLAKQLKESMYGLDLLVEESHLLPAYPQPSKPVKKVNKTFAEGVSAHEKPNTSERAKAWVFASDAAGISTKEYVSEKLEDGQNTLLGSKATLAELQNLLGESSKVEDSDQEARVKNVWEKLDGRLGVLNIGE